MAKEPKERQKRTNGKPKRSGSAKRRRGGQIGQPVPWTNLPNGKPVELPYLTKVVIRLGQSLAALPTVQPT